jgi:hypothetical protein
MTNINEKFFVVTDKPSNGDRYLKKDSRIKVLSSDREALEYIVGIGKDDNDPRKVVRIFSVNEFGTVTFHEVVFNGKLELKAQPEEAPKEAPRVYGTI